MAKVFKTLEALFKKADTQQARYQEALEKHQEQLIQLQRELQEKNMLLKDMHKMKLLGDLSEATYEAEKEKVAVLQAKVQEVQKELRLIQLYETEDIHSIIAELDAEKSKVFKGNQMELEQIKLELMESKLVYLNKLKEAHMKYNELVAPERKLDSLKIKMGIKKNSYVSGSHDALSMYAVKTGGHENLLVQQSEVYDCLEYGRTPERLNKIVTEAKEKGIL
jgi:hypothetical protein